MPFPKIHVPTAKTALPSSGQEVMFEHMTGHSEKLLLMAKETGESEEILSTVKQVVANCLVDRTIDVDDLPIFDVEWLFIKIRIASIGAVTKVAYVDRSDGKRYDFEIDLNDVEVIRPEGALETIRVSDDVVVKLRWPSAGSFVRPEVLNAATDVDTAHQIAISAIDSVYEGDSVLRADDHPRAEVDDFVSSFDTDSYNKLLTHVSALPRLNYVIEYVNSKGEERKVVLSTLTDFFRFR